MEQWNEIDIYIKELFNSFMMLFKKNLFLIKMKVEKKFNNFCLSRINGRTRIMVACYPGGGSHYGIKLIDLINN